MKLFSLLGLLPAAVFASNILDVTFVARDKNQLYDFISNNDHIDYGCRPVIISSEGEHKVRAFVSESQLHHYKRSLDVSAVRVSQLPRARTIPAPIGKGDRFQGGYIVPRGLGSRKPEDYATATQGGILNPNEVQSALKALSTEYGILLFAAPHKTYEGNIVLGGVATNTKTVNKKRQYIYFTGGIHARERGGPDNLIYLISDLLYANKRRTGLTYGTKTYSYEQVQKVLGAGIVFIPMTNPDGVRFDQQFTHVSKSWRKNRNPASATRGKPETIGVDLNRNFDFLWDFKKYYIPSATPASDDPASIFFKGTAPFSEPETKNIRWVYDLFPNISWYVDMHNHAGHMYYSWGDDQNQNTSATQNFMNPAYDGKRGGADQSVYGEYIDQQDWENIKQAANVTATNMTAVGGRLIQSQQSFIYYPTSGSSDDWTFSRWHRNKNVKKVYGFTLEFGGGGFYPTMEAYINNILDTNAGLMDFVLNAVDTGL